jgi:hypothetical protein
LARNIKTGSCGITETGPRLNRKQFLKKRLWQKGIWDHVIRNDFDLQENLDYIAMNPVREGYVKHPQFYPYTGFLY